MSVDGKLVIDLTGSPTSSSAGDVGRTPSSKSKRDTGGKMDDDEWKPETFSDDYESDDELPPLEPGEPGFGFRKPALESQCLVSKNVVPPRPPARPAGTAAPTTTAAAARTATAAASAARTMAAAALASRLRAPKRVGSVSQHHRPPTKRRRWQPPTPEPEASTPARVATPSEAPKEKKRSAKPKITRHSKVPVARLLTANDLKDEYFSMILSWDLTQSPSFRVSERAKHCERVHSVRVGKGGSSLPASAAGLASKVAAEEVNSGDSAFELADEAEKYARFENSDEYVSEYRPLLEENIRAEFKAGLEATGTDRGSQTLSRLKVSSVTRRSSGMRASDSRLDVSLTCATLGDTRGAVNSAQGCVIALYPSSEARTLSARLPQVHCLAFVSRASARSGRGDLHIRLSIPRNAPNGSRLGRIEDALRAAAKEWRTMERRLRRGREGAAQSMSILGGERRSGAESVTEFSALVIGKTATTLREFIALHNIVCMPLRDAILEPQAPTPGSLAGQRAARGSEQLGPAFCAHLHKKLNNSQVVSILSCVERRPFTLLQGPPGTGKTRTAVALLNVLHTLIFNRNYQSRVANVREIRADISRRQDRGGATAVARSSYVGPWNTAAPPKLRRLSSNSSVQDIIDNLYIPDDRTLTRVEPKPHILVCAPSNAAVDEIVERTMQNGFHDLNLRHYRPDMIRLGGNRSRIRKSVAEAVSLDARVEQILGVPRATTLRHIRLERKHLANQYSKRDTILHIVRQRALGGGGGEALNASGMPSNEQLERDLAAVLENAHCTRVRIRRLQLAADVSERKLSPGLVRRALKASILDEAQIVFCTLSTSGSAVLLEDLRRPWDIIIIDEAAQSSELSTLVALQHRSQACVLIGDPQQLPATVQMHSGNQRLFQQSLFERLAKGGHEVQMLDIQYRMHPAISAFPSAYFYDSRLQDGDNVRSAEWTRSYHSDPRFGPLRFFDVESKQTRDQHTKSLSNKVEAAFAVKLVTDFAALLRDVEPHPARPVTLGIITPYSQQRSLLERAVANANRNGGWNGYLDVKVATVDGFQGGERDVIVISTVRSESSGLGFLADTRRMNVALTRARHACWVVGDSRALQINPSWKAFLQHAKRNGEYKTLSDGKLIDAL